MPIRSPALVINQSGEPTLLATQLNYDPWMVVIYHEEKRVRKGKKIKLYTEAKRLKEGLEEKHPKEEGWEVCIVSRQVGYGPPYSKITDEQLMDLNNRGLRWCPYCRAMREYLYFPRMECYRCPVCHITDRDFHVRKNNPMYWDPDIRKILEENHAINEVAGER